MEQHRICIVADEAHRSHGGGVTSQLHEALGGQSDQPAFITYVAFTATPDPKVGARHAATRTRKLASNLCASSVKRVMEVDKEPFGDCDWLSSACEVG